jgi:hypothetical protein
MHVKHAIDLVERRPDHLIECAQLCVRRGLRVFKVQGKLQ